MDYKYDVVISYSRKDYVDEGKNIIPGNAISAITEAFDQNDITYWIDREGIKSGQEFKDEIIDAIGTAKVFLFVSSINSNASQWTRSEIFEAYDSKKYIIPIKIDDCEYDRSVKFELRPLDFIEYFSDKNGALKKLVRSVNSYKEEIDKQKKRQQLESQKAEIKEKIKLLEDDYRLSADRHEVALKEIQQLYTKLGITTRDCPICDKEVAISDTYCERCGWQFPALPSSQADRKKLNIIKANWRIIHAATTSKEEIKALKNEIYDLKEALKKAESEKKNYEKSFSDLKKEIEQLLRSKEKVLSESKEQKEQIALLTSQRKEMEFRLAEKGADYDSSIKKMQKETEKMNALVSALKAENEELTKKNKDLSAQYNTAQKAAKKAKDAADKAKKSSFLSKLTNKDWVVANVIVGCKTKPYIFLSDSLNSLNLTVLITSLKDYGLVMTRSDFRNCHKVEDVVNQINITASFKLQTANNN